MACAQFAQPGAAFGRCPTPGPTVAYGDERPVRLTGDEPFDAADDLELAPAGLPGGVVLGGLVVSQADDGDKEKYDERKQPEHKHVRSARQTRRAGTLQKFKWGG